MKEIDTILKEHDLHHTGKIEFDEFKAMLVDDKDDELEHLKSWSVNALMSLESQVIWKRAKFARLLVSVHM